MKKIKLKINGFRKIVTGEVQFKKAIKLTDTTIYIVCYLLDNKPYFMFETGIQYIGYTDDAELSEYIQYYTDKQTYQEFIKFVGRS